ncbi:MAG: hypothetical protein JNL74_14960 [Fibrobacteres bacterium]|nr:hypothetical protein [Fibrobacterota bacterium]
METIRGSSPARLKQRNLDIEIHDEEVFLHIYSPSNSEGGYAIHVNKVDLAILLR